jgi:hypothetical protein
MMLTILPPDSGNQQFLRTAFSLMHAFPIQPMTAKQTHLCKLFDYELTNKYINESVSYMIQRGFNLAVARALDSLRAERSIDNAA